MTRRYFITGTSTNVGKTVVGCAIAYAASHRRKSVVAVKPFETGCTPEAHDAIALAKACNRPDVAKGAAFYRARAALSPYAATLNGETEPRPMLEISQQIDALSRDADLVLIEGAGGLLVPITAQQTTADFAKFLDASLILVTANKLGTLSFTLSAVESARARQLPIAAVVLNEPVERDASFATNARVLRQYLPEVPVLEFPQVALVPDSLAAAAQANRLLQVIDPSWI